MWRIYPHYYTIFLGLFEKSSDKYWTFEFMPQSIDFRDAIPLKNYSAHILVKKFKKNMQKSKFTLFTQ
jgi:4-diphosphocytidyl-2C-methyl-D-erythritol kinase